MLFLPVYAGSHSGLLTLSLQDTLLLALHPSARNVLGERNIAFLTGPDHKALRKSFLALFTRKALSVSEHVDFQVKSGGWL
jgi:cytochrome P450